MDTRTDDPGAAPFRSDTLILLRVRRHGAEAVWFPRDLLVDIPGHGPDRINQAVALGGPSLAVDTLRRNFGIRVDHYAEIDMDAVPAMVDAVGGVRLDFPEPVRDDLSGFATGAGCRALDGRDATALARSRNMQALRGGTWSTIDTAADLDRAARQQSLIRALTTAVHAEVDRHPTRLLHLVDVVLEHIRVDSTLDRGGALTLARALLGVGGRTLEVTTLPVALPPGSPAYVIPAEGSDAVIAGVGGSRSRRAAPAVAVSDAGRYAPC
jgi:LCP family protein required for cell wall assembly